ncbi:hypothetical protein A3D80_04320 [Candidatus Roizmanbacteria bacterium RIFCSPHIGHO2_02_FULL_40_13b]|uniref:Glycosyltransferase 2-like domain-containing protein n=1 Tax=Candidatus Roizmanbacteria bacterium RIFCSPHIGHO2_01_FULL_39_24 TaxID=1802032 RepID=A0A1F7GMV8_9BACT|nr:MAG: hypothetical protein A2799_00180 [Candidatus Roizmanbacteria bacterium RIFCSPHIGHO2_01_FULL_39_24]OGK27736.1 MAG: hypothetical protein A3D80_04320 [Candidatus Roizmanbacteria bacterium RIFCSPHIGHO2_02_FULL_40_13b]OGK49500.1 MAG: hypothetical protein A3A56_02010 [Candidatus Roizmanbacteria bacterium RIFCSPLOWO2_01_FULL_40_32]OGK56658.1 MAG: hypothetical protein A3H83_01340 [Candidatus Roizmanbacteria bacterium RIFCSPLOWO2_02_FULL_39_8]
MNPKITVIIPLITISDFLVKEALPALDEQSYKNMEVIVLPNKKERINNPLLKKYSFLKIIPTPHVSRPALKRDIGAKHAKGEILAFIDDDAFPQKQWLEKAILSFKRRDVGAVCGPGILPKSAQFWEKVFDEVLKTAIGSGGFAYRFVKKNARYVDDFPSMNFLIKKNLFKKLGGFDSDYWPGEDSKLCEDLVYKLHEKIYYDPSVTIYHHRRNELQGYLKQHGNYGFHRGAFFAHGDRNSRRITYLIPTIFVIYTILISLFLLNYTVMLNLFQHLNEIPKQVRDDKYLLIIFIPVLLYKLLLLGIAFSAFKNTKSLKIAFSSAIVLFLTHLVYGVQFIRGFFTGKIKREKIYN